MHGRRDAIDAHRHAARERDFRCDLGGRQNPAVARLGALRQLDRDHLDLIFGGLSSEFLVVETAVGIAAAEIAGSDLPDQIAAEFAVMHRNRAFAGVVREAALFRAMIERPDRIGRQGPETHRRDVVYRQFIGFGAAGAYGNAEIAAGDHARRERVADPLVAALLDVEFGAERAAVDLALGALIDHAAFFAGKWRAVVFAFEKILANFRPNGFKQEPKLPK